MSQWFYSSILICHSKKKNNNKNGNRYTLVYTEICGYNNSYSGTLYYSDNEEMKLLALIWMDFKINNIGWKRHGHKGINSIYKKVKNKATYIMSYFLYIHIW